MNRQPHRRSIYVHALFAAVLALFVLAAFPSRAHAGLEVNPTTAQSHTKVLLVPRHYASIQTALMFAIDDDTILVSPGTYHEAIHFNGKNVVVMSSDGPFVTKITDDHSSAIVTFDAKETRGAVLQGFTIDGGYTGIWCKNASPTIQNNILINQQAVIQAAVVFYSSGSTQLTSPAAFVNNAVANCPGGAVSVASFKAPEIRNNILTNCAFGVKRSNHDNIPQPELRYNDIWNCAARFVDCSDTLKNPDEDPLLTARYSLFRGSPCIDAGDPALCHVDADGSRNDIGAAPVIHVGGGSNFATIQSAVDAARERDVILVADGTYHETVTIRRKDVTLLSETPYGGATITNDSDKNLVVFTHGVTQDAQLDGFVLDGGWIGIWCQEAAPTITHCLIKNQHVTNWAAVVFSGYGYAAWGVAPAVFINNTIVNCANGGLSTFSRKAPVIKNTIISGCKYGVHHQGSNGSIEPMLSYNDIWNCRDSLYYNCPDTGAGSFSGNPDLVGPYFDLSPT